MGKQNPTDEPNWLWARALRALWRCRRASSSESGGGVGSHMVHTLQCLPSSRDAGADRQLVDRCAVKRVWARDLWHLSNRLLHKVLMHTWLFCSALTWAALPCDWLGSLPPENSHIELVECVPCVSRGYPLVCYTSVTKSLASLLLILWRLAVPPLTIDRQAQTGSGEIASQPGLRNMHSPRVTRRAAHAHFW